MSKKKLKSDGIYFTGKASEEVTGSQYLVRFGNTQCLLECGLHQSPTNSYLDAYKINSEKFRFNPAEIDFVFINHPHIDHCGLIPRLVKEGFNGQIIVTKNTNIIMKSLLLNSCYIINEEAKILSKKYKRDYQPLYREEDVYRTFELMKVYDEYNEIIKLNDTISFQWLYNSHCIGAAQLQLILSSKEKTKKILYTSDLGALNTDNNYLHNSEIPTMFNDCTILESTYGDITREVKRTRNNDLEHFKTAVNSVLERKGSVILPCFSFSRTQELLTTLYDIYGQDENFNTRVVVDSKLSCEISKLYFDVLDGENLNKWKNVCNWENVSFISEKIDSRVCLEDETPKIIISSSGFCTNGRIVNYLKKYIKDDRSMIIFTGYTGNNASYLSYRIKNYRDHKFISINKEKILNKADCLTLSTFSSHASRKDLITYGGNLNTLKLILVHGDMESKMSIAESLKQEVSKNNKSYRVISSSRGMIVRL